MQITAVRYFSRARYNHCKNASQKPWLLAGLNMSKHVISVCKSAFFHLHNIRHIKNYLSRENLLTLVHVHAFITSRLDYCNSLLYIYGVPKEQISKLQRVQNAAARLVMDIGKYSHITPALHDLHWLSIHACIHFKILLLAFKVIHGQAPAYLSSLVPVKSKSHYSLRSNCSTLLKPPTGKMLVTIGGRSFQAAAPQLWNALPPSLRDVASVETFKKNLKTFLLRKAYADRFTLNKF